jgi:hypothetical protein
MILVICTNCAVFHLHKYPISDHDFSALSGCDFKYDNETVEDWFSLSVSIGYKFNENHSVLLSVRKLTDEELPYVSSLTNGYASSVHDWLGRRWNVRYTFKF